MKRQADNAIVADKAAVRSSGQLLDGELSLFRALQTNLTELERECARHFASTPEAFITSLKGIGITLASPICAETGALSAIKHGDSLTAYSGIVPKVKQTGGPESPARDGGVFGGGFL